MTADLAAFAQALRAPGTPAPPGLKAWNGSDVRRRFDVHRNTLLVSLTQALGDSLPVCRQALGAACFDALARGFVLAHPPASPVLAAWGDGFAPWLERSAAAAAWPWLADLARLERARVCAFHAADAAPLAPARLAAALADAPSLPASRPVLHPSCALVVADWAVLSLWAAHQGDALPADLAVLERPEAALVLRDDTSAASADDDSGVRVLPLPLAGVAFCAALSGGCSFAEAVSAAGTGTSTHAGTPAFDLAGMLALLIRHGALVAWLAPGEPA
ncbi:MAG: DNA-binding domain-containing protein [Pseudomonadota bacterium]